MQGPVGPRLIGCRGALALFALFSCATGIITPVPADPRPRDDAGFEVDYRVREFDRVIDFATATGSVLNALTRSRYDTFLYTETTHLNLNDDVTLDFRIPYLSAHIAGFVESAGSIARIETTASGIQPITINPRFYVRDQDAEGGGYYIDLKFDVGVRDGADPLEQQVLNFLREGGLLPWQTLFASGFNLFVDNVWTWRWGTRRLLELHGGFLYAGEYSPVSDIPAHVNPADVVKAHAAYTYQPRKKDLYRWDLELAGYTTSYVENPRADQLVGFFPGPFIPGKARGLDHKLDTTLKMDYDHIATRRDATRLTLFFGLPGKYDLLASDASILRNVVPNPTYGAGAAWFHKASRRERWGYGLTFDHVGHVAVGALQVPDAQRDALTGDLQFDRTFVGGYSFFCRSSVGLTVDAPRIVGASGFRLRF